MMTSLLLRPESFRVFFSSVNYGFCHLNVAGITKFKYEKKNEKDSGRSSKMAHRGNGPLIVLSGHFLLICFLRNNFENTLYNLEYILNSITLL